MTYDEMIVKIKAKENFSWSRWGDGEWSAVLGKPGQNVDGHTYFPDMGKRLGDILKAHPKYGMAIQAKAVRDMGIEIDNWLKSNNVNINWTDSDIIHTANEAGDIGLLLQALAQRKVILVGPRHLFNLKLGYEMVVVPPKNCWLAYESIKHEILKRLSNNTVVLFACSMPAEVIMDDMFNMYGDTITQVDIGSALDVHAGKPSRRYHERMMA